MSDINNILPENIKSVEEAREWLLVHGYSVDVANEELKNWNPEGVDETPEPDPEPEVEVEEDDEDEDEDWDDEEDEDWDDDEDDEDEE